MGDQAKRTETAKVKMKKMIGWMIVYIFLYLIMPPTKPITCDIIYYGHGSRYAGVQAFYNKDTFNALVRFGYQNHTGKEYGGRDAILLDSQNVFIPHSRTY